jgi:hypothetical protein
MDQHQNVISRTRNPICMTHRVRIKINKKTEGKKMSYTDAYAQDHRNQRERNK